MVKPDDDEVGWGKKLQFPVVDEEYVALLSRLCVNAEYVSVKGFDVLNFRCWIRNIRCLHIHAGIRATVEQRKCMELVARQIDGFALVSMACDVCKCLAIRRSEILHLLPAVVAEVRLGESRK